MVVCYCSHVYNHVSYNQQCPTLCILWGAGLCVYVFCVLCNVVYSGSVSLCEQSVKHVFHHEYIYSNVSLPVLVECLYIVYVMYSVL